MKKTSKITNRQKWVSVAACFVLVAVIGVGVFQSNLFGTKNDIATLNDGETITFVKNDLSQSSINLNVTTRPLSDAEIEMLFADLPVTADAYFDADNHNILGFEGKIDDTRMVVSKQGVNLLENDYMKENTLSYTTRIGKTTFIVNVKQSESAKR